MTWTGGGITSAVWWALSTLLTTTDFWASLVATALGVYGAFELERWRDRRHVLEQYARALNAVRYESAQLHAVCQQALAVMPNITSYELEAPALREFVGSESLQTHGSHALAVVLGSVLAFVGAARNSLAYFRSQVHLGGTPILTTHLAPLGRHLTRLVAGIEHAQALMDRDLQRLQRGVRPTDEDRAIIDAFRAATQ